MTVLGLDLGASKLAACMQLSTESFYFRADLPNTSVIAKDKKIIQYFLQDIKTKIPAREPLFVGFSSAATVDSRGVVNRWPNRPSWGGFGLKSYFEEVLEASLIIEDDGNAAAYAEAKAHGVNDLLYIGIGSGISGGIILENKIWRGVNRNAAEFGHVVMPGSGKKCSCGRHGCLQASLSAGSFLEAIFGTQYRGKNRDDIRQLLDAKDPLACSVLKEKAKILAEFLLMTNEILDVPHVVIGGGFGSDFPELLLQLRDALQKSLRRGQVLPKLISSYYHERSSLMGVVELATENRGKIL